MCTIAALGLFAAFSFVKTTKLLSQDDPFVGMVTVPKVDDKINLNELNYLFALEKTDPRYARVKANHVSWERGIDKVRTAIELKSCNEIDLESNEYWKALL